ncbi:MAG TPA: hypothetical protein VKV19_03775, partial [Ktedonobacteraceae bacterium]|nr:hypothetical protein [Ktedonobacteraceae bacterium]
WLNRFEGVGPKTTACVLLFSCQKPVLPVDTHVHRGSIRLGLIGKKVSADAAHTLLQALLPQDSRSIYNFHKALLRHGQRMCVFDRPRCKTVYPDRSVRLLPIIAEIITVRIHSSPEKMCFAIEKAGSIFYKPTDKRHYNK